MALAPPGAKCFRAAFTLLELLAVLAVIAILTGIVIGAGRRVAEKGQVARAKAELALLATALEDYRRTYGDYPQTDDAARFLQSLLGRRGPANAVIQGRAFIETARFTIADARNPFTDASARLVDPWGQSYGYAYQTSLPWTNSGYVLYSAGPDGIDFPRLMAGGFPDVDAAANTDNIHANR